MKVNARAFGLLVCSITLLILIARLLVVRGHSKSLLSSPIPKLEEQILGSQSVRDTTINYKDGFLAENTCCKGLPRTISEIAQHCLDNTDFDQLKTNQTDHHKEKTQSGQQCSCNDIFLCRLVVVTGFSSNHFEEAQDMIASVQHHLPNTRLIVYDLGLTTEERDLVESYCNVEYRKFNFNHYPNHAKDLKTCAFKPIIIEEISKEYEVVMWGDSSVRIMSPHFVSTLFPYFKRFPFIPGPPSNLPAVALTHVGMIDYLNVTETRKQLDVYHITIQAGCWIMWINKLMREMFLNLWVDCALHHECIAPHGSRLGPCDLSKRYYCNCHRYDQSALNLILIKIVQQLDLKVLDTIFNYPFKDVFEKVFHVARHVTKHFTPTKKC